MGYRPLIGTLARANRAAAPCPPAARSAASWCWRANLEMFRAEARTEGGTKRPIAWLAIRRTYIHIGDTCKEADAQRLPVVILHLLRPYIFCTP